MFYLKLYVFCDDHIFNPSEYFAIDSNHLLKCPEICHINVSNYLLHLLWMSKFKCSTDYFQLFLSAKYPFLN